MSLYYPDKTIALTFVDVLRLMPKANIRNFYDLRANAALMNALEKQFENYMSNGGVYFNSDGQERRRGKAFGGKMVKEIPPSTYYLVSMDVIEKITGVPAASEEEIMNTIVPNTKLEVEAILK